MSSFSLCAEQIPMFSGIAVSDAIMSPDLERDVP